MTVTPKPAEEYFGSAAQVSILKRARALFDVPQGDGRFFRMVAQWKLSVPTKSSIHLLTRPAKLQGALHIALVALQAIDKLLVDIAAAGPQATQYARWKIGLIQKGCKRVQRPTMSMPTCRMACRSSVCPRKPLPKSLLLSHRCH